MITDIQGNSIHSTVVIDNGADIGQGNYFGPFCYIGPNVVIGRNNRFEGHCSVGMPAEHKDYWSPTTRQGLVKIGNNNVIREFTTINEGTLYTTEMWNNCIMLRGSHLSHDSVLHNNVTLSCNVLIGGHTTVMQGANLGLGAIVHQHQVIGAYAMLGMGAVVPKKAWIEPGKIYVGNPCKFLKENTVGLKRGGVSAAMLESFNQDWVNRKALQNLQSPP